MNGHSWLLYTHDRKFINTKLEEKAKAARKREREPEKEEKKKKKHSKREGEYERRKSDTSELK